MTTAREQNFDNLYNEGGEGYNPYRGETKVARPMVAVVRQTTEAKVAFKGHVKTRTEWLATLAADEARLDKCDAFGREIMERRIVELRAALGM
jgi:hypothetical protein